MVRLFCRAKAVIPRRDIDSIRTNDGLGIILPVNQRTDTEQPALAGIIIDDPAGTVAVIP